MPTEQASFTHEATVDRPGDQTGHQAICTCGWKAATIHRSTHVCEPAVGACRDITGYWRGQEVADLAAREDVYQHLLDVE